MSMPNNITNNNNKTRFTPYKRESAAFSDSLKRDNSLSIESYMMRDDNKSNSRTLTNSSGSGQIYI